jgi:hypothetical protein
VSSLTIRPPYAIYSGTHIRHTPKSIIPLDPIVLGSTKPKNPLEHNPLSSFRTHKISKTMGWTCAEGYALHWMCLLIIVYPVLDTGKSIEELLQWLTPSRVAASNELTFVSRVESYSLARILVYSHCLDEGFKSSAHPIESILDLDFGHAHGSNKTALNRAFNFEGDTVCSTGPKVIQQTMTR